MYKFVGYLFLVFALFLFGMLAPTIGYMASSEGAPLYMIALSMMVGSAFIAARAGYENEVL